MGSHRKHTIDPKDGGWGSRKLIFSVGAVVVLVACWVCTGHWPKLSTSYSDLATGVMGVLGLFVAGNVSNKFAVVKAMGVLGGPAAGDDKDPPPGK